MTKKKQIKNNNTSLENILLDIGDKKQAKYLKNLREGKIKIVENQIKQPKILYIPKQNRENEGIILPDEDLTYTSLTKRIKDYFVKNKDFPDEIFLDIDDYLMFPTIFNPGDKQNLKGNIKDGWDFLGIKIKIKK